MIVTSHAETDPFRSPADRGPRDVRLDAQAFAKMLLSGRPEKCTDRVEARVDSLLSFFFGQRKVIEAVDIPASHWPRFSNLIGSRHHFIIFWGFLIICLGTLETFAQDCGPRSPGLSSWARPWPACLTPRWTA